MVMRGHTNSDMDKCVKFSSVRFFADDTKVSKQIASEVDAAQLQEELNSIIEWQKNNNMMIHEDKFELMVHLHRPRFELYQLPFVCDQMTIDVQSFFWRYSLKVKKILES